MSFPAPPGVGTTPVQPPSVGAPWTPPRGPLPTIDVLVVPYAYARISAAAARLKRIVIFRIVSLGITGVILGLVQLWRHLSQVDSAVFGWPYWVIFGVSIGVSLALLAVSVFQWLRARDRVRALRPEPVLVIARPGVELAGEQVSWSSVAGLAARTRRWTGDVFEVHRVGGPPLVVSFDLLDAAPSRLDSAARAFSGGRVGVDFSRMDN